jgi:outer membrane protein assembly factor BamB
LLRLQRKIDLGEGPRRADAHAPGIRRRNSTLALWRSPLSRFDQEAGSFIVALDKRSGKELWRQPRDERSSWSTPLAVEHAGRKQIIVTGTTKVRSYDPESGKILWSLPAWAPMRYLSPSTRTALST